MSYQIVLQLEDVAGVLARVMRCMSKLGLKVIDQSFEALPEGGRKLILEVEGPMLSDTQLRSTMEALQGVVGLLGDETTPAIPMQTEAATPLTEPATRYQNKDSEAGDVDIRDRMLIFTLLSRYPNLSGKLLEIRNSIPEPERAGRMLELGHGFGRHLSKNLKVDGVVGDLRSAIELLLVSGLSPLAQISQYSEGVRISGYTKNLKHLSDKPECCRFLAGTIQGLLDSAEALPQHRVEETQCLHDGAASCEFRLSPA